MIRRRELLYIMANPSIFDSMLEVVDSFTPSENSGQHKFLFTPIEGTYILIANPPGNIAFAETQVDNSLSMSFFQLENRLSLTARGAFTTVCRSSLYTTATLETHYDRWTPVILIENDGVTITPAGAENRRVMRANVTYYLCKVKGN